VIKINLLPVKRAAKKAKSCCRYGDVQLVVGLGIVLVFVGPAGIAGRCSSMRSRSRPKSRRARRKELDALKNEGPEVEDYEEEQAVLEDKNRIHRATSQESRGAGPAA